jgi:hypothetical protein
MENFNSHLREASATNRDGLLFYINLWTMIKPGPSNHQLQWKEPEDYKLHWLLHYVHFDAISQQIVCTVYWCTPLFIDPEKLTSGMLS